MQQILVVRTTGPKTRYIIQSALNIVYGETALWLIAPHAMLKIQIKSLRLVG